MKDTSCIHCILPGMIPPRPPTEYVPSARYGELQCNFGCQRCSTRRHDGGRHGLFGHISLMDKDPKNHLQSKPD